MLLFSAFNIDSDNDKRSTGTTYTIMRVYSFFSLPAHVWPPFGRGTLSETDDKKKTQSTHNAIINHWHVYIIRDVSNCFLEFRICAKVGNSEGRRNS